MEVAVALSIAVIGAGSTAQAVTYVKADNASALTAAASYVANSGSPTTSADFIQFDSNYGTTAIANTAVLTLGGFIVSGTGASGTTATIGIGSSSTNTWTVGNGTATGVQTLIDMSAAGRDLTFNNANGFFRLNGGSGSVMVFNVTSGRTLTFFQKFTALGNNKTLRLDGSGTVIFNGAMASGANPFGFNVNGANVQLNAANTFALGTGAFTVTAGSVTVGNVGALGGVSTVNLAGGRLGFSVGGGTYTQNLAVTGTTSSIGQDANLSSTFSGNLTGAGTLSNFVSAVNTDNTNAMIFSGTDMSGFTGTINYTDSLTNNTAWWRIGASSAITNLSGAKLVLNAGTGSTKNFGLADGISGATLRLGELSGDGLLQGAFATSAPVTNNTLEVGNDNASTTFSGTIGIASAWMDALILNKVGSGTLTLSGHNVYYGGTTVSAGTLAIGNGGTTGDIGVGAVVDNGTLAFNRSDSVSFNNGISGTGAVTMNGTGTLVLGTTNTFSGALTINGNGGVGAVRFDSATAAQNATSVAVNVANGLTFGTGITAVTLNAISGAGAVALVNSDTNAVALTFGTNGSTYSGVFSGTGSIIKAGAGTTVLATSGQSYSGTTGVSGGTLQFSASGNTASNLIGAGALNLSGGGRVRFNSTSGATFNSALDVGTGGGTLSFRGNSTFSPTAITGSGLLTLDIDNTFTVTPTSFQGWAGSINVSSTGAGANLRLASTFDNTSLGNASLNLATAGISLTRNAGTNGATTTTIGTLSGVAGTFVGGNSNSGTGIYTFSIGSRNEAATFAGSIIDSLTKTALIKTGTEVQTLSGTNTYSQGTTVSGGTLLLTGAGTAGTGSVTVGAAGTLSLATNSGISDAATLNVIAGGLINVTGGIEVVGTLNLGGSIFTSGSFGGLNSGADNINTTYFSDTTLGNYVLVPEPTSLSLIGLAASGMLARRRRSAKK